jgi:hypothetical protein
LARCLYLVWLYVYIWFGLPNEELCVLRYLYIVAGPPTLSGQEFSYSEIGKTEVGKTEIGKTEIGKTEIGKTEIDLQYSNSRANLITTNKLNM